MQLAVCLCIYITKDHTQRGVEGQVCTLSAIGEGEGFGDGLCLSMKLLATFSPSTSTGSSHHPRLLIQAFMQLSLSKAQHCPSLREPLQGSAFPSLHQSLLQGSVYKPSNLLPQHAFTIGLLCFVCKRDLHLLLASGTPAVGHASHAMQHLSSKPCKPCNATPIQ